MIEIKDPVLKRLLLEHLIEQMDQGGLDQLLESGVWPEVLDSLRQRTARDLLQVSIMDIKLGFNVDSAGVMEAFTRLDAVRRDNELKEYFVIAGASPEVMAKLCGVDLSFPAFKPGAVAQTAAASASTAWSGSSAACANGCSRSSKRSPKPQQSKQHHVEAHQERAHCYRPHGKRY